ncbi:MAG: hypothetical protein ACRDV3_14475, partial [Acidothermaceae bacterium]
MQQLTAAGPGPATTEERPLWFDAFLVGVAVLAIFALTAQYHDPLNTDSRGSALAAWQLAHHGNSTLTAFKGQAAWLFPSHGRLVTNRLPGTILWATPFYKILGSKAAPPVYPGTIAASAAAAIAVALAFTLCCRVATRRVAVVAALMFAFATGTWTVSSDQLWTHGPAQLAVLLTVLLASEQRWLLAGLPAGFAILVRPHLAVVAIVLAAYAAARARSVKPFLIVVGCCISTAFLITYNYALWHRLEIFGGYNHPVAASGQKALDFVTGFFGDFIAPERGLLVMSPVLLL